MPIQAQVTLDTSGRMLLGTDIGASSAILYHLGVDVVGLNCSTGPEHMREPVRYLTQTSPCRSRPSPTRGCRSTSTGAPSIPWSRSHSRRRWPTNSASAAANGSGSMG